MKCYLFLTFAIGGSYPHPKGCELATAVLSRGFYLFFLPVGQAPVKGAFQPFDILGIAAHELSFGVGNLGDRAAIAFDKLHDLVERFQTAVVGKERSDTEPDLGTVFETNIKVCRTFEIEGVGEEQCLLHRVSTELMDCGNHLFAPFVRVSRVMAETVPDTDIVAGEVHEEEVGTDAVGEVDAVTSLVLLLPCVHHETVGICGVVHRVSLADCFDRFMGDGSDRLHVILQRQVHIRCAKEYGITEHTALLGLRKCTDEVVLNLAGETTAETEFGERTDTVFATSKHVNLLVDSTDSFRFEFGMVLVVVVEIDFVDDGQDVDFEVSVTHQRVRIATSFDSHVRRGAFVISHTYLVTVKTEHAQEMHERGCEPRSLGEEQVKLFTAER